MFGLTALKRAATPTTTGLITASAVFTATQRAVVGSLLQRARLSSAKDSTAVGTSLPTLEIDAFKRSKAFKRPTSPHLFIYQPQLTWGLSLFHRVTGGFLGVGAIWYLVAPFTSAAAAAYVASLPFIVKFVAKSALALPLAYHSFNGLRHLFWDTASKFGLSLSGVYSTGYSVLAATVVVGFGYMVTKVSLSSEEKALLPLVHNFLVKIGVSEAAKILKKNFPLVTVQFV
ncbi:cytochrome b subunit of succinate dehydrogenase, Sdh3p [Physocladia obscura]|uniref:Cytochrome b subunit of succinate dehydrogenase, Sdh3p n=1 Tax=Physocladia obscura TaxID=109957 RepID=A0AAD5X8P3_9FUNG|nr:cytochrome b subunit of succinate dehydrogenase, Sdh3p [Physocladia obscura]